MCTDKRIFIVQLVLFKSEHCIQREGDRMSRNFLEFCDYL